MDIKLSAIICTFNRAHYLRKALQSLVDQTLPKEQYEIIVVDNRSTDNSSQVVRGEFGSVSNLRYLYEPVLGLSGARNSGWRSAKGEYVAYMDDDAIACPRWLEKILDAFETVKPRPGCVGGKIEPIWGAPRPLWLSDKIVTYLAVLDLSEVPISSNNRQLLAGANIAFPRCLLETIGGFHVGLGRRGNNLLSNEEIMLVRQLMSSGHSCFYHPEISVSHHIASSRLNKGWFIRRMYWEGVSEAFVQMHQESPSTLKRLRMGITQALSVLLSPQRLVSLILTTNNPDLFAWKCTTLMKVGYILGLLGIER